MTWERSHVRKFWEAIIQKHFDDTSPQTFKNDQDNIWDAVQQDWSAG